jgi:hypothetical protein
VFCANTFKEHRNELQDTPEQITEGDKVATCWTFCATQQVAILVIAPTADQYDSRGITSPIDKYALPWRAETR